MSSRLETPEQIREFVDGWNPEINIEEYWDALGMSPEALIYFIQSLGISFAMQGYRIPPVTIGTLLTMGAQFALHVAD